MEFQISNLTALSTQPTYASHLSEILKLREALLLTLQQATDSEGIARNFLIDEWRNILSALSDPTREKLKITILKLNQCGFIALPPPIQWIEENIPPPNSGETSNQTQPRANNKRTLTSVNSQDNDGFIHPRKVGRPQTLVEINSTPVEHRFDNLENEEMEEGYLEETDSQLPTTRVEKPEAFYIEMKNNWRNNINEMFRIIGAELPIKVTGTLAKITPTTIEQYREIQRYLSERPDIKFFGMKIRSERPKKNSHQRSGN